MVHHTGLHSAPAEYYFTHNGELNISKRVGKKYLMGQELWRVGGDTDIWKYRSFDHKHTSKE